jgi:aryl-alcohol dehydrogenase-like predicted oxidoreductase
LQYRTLGRTGVSVSPFSLGTMLFGGAVDDADAAREVEIALDAGINSIDTANIYGRGASEEMLGRILRRTPHRDRLVLASKVHCTMADDDPNAGGNSRRHLIDQCDASLRRLGVDHLDIYYVHRPTTQVPIDETLRALDDLVRAGKIRYIGTSSFASWQLLEALWAAKEHHLNRPVVEQSPYSLVDRSVERELLPMTASYGIGFAVWSPLAGGLLTGKYQSGKKPTGTRFVRGEGDSWDTKHFRDTVDPVIDAIVDMAKDKGCTPAQLSLAWLLTQATVSTVVLGARTADQLAEQLPALDVKLDDDDLARIDAVIPPGRAVVPYYLDDAFADFSTASVPLVTSAAARRRYSWRASRTSRANSTRLAQCSLVSMRLT